MELQVVTMTPDWAHELIEKHNVNNRKVRRDVVQAYVHAIKSGQYKLTHQGVAIGTNGVLLDGQHRLLAIVESGIQVPIVMATECDPSIYDVLDTGCTRKSVDVLGAYGAQDAGGSSSTVRTYIMYHEHHDKIWQGRLRYPNNTEILEFYQTRSEQVDYASRKGKAVWSAFKQVKSHSAVATFILLALDRGYPRSHIEFFTEKLATGSNLEDTCPILRFRAGAINGIIEQVRHNQRQATLASLIKTFNDWNNGVERRLFRIPPMPPMPVVAPYNEERHGITGIV